MSKNFEILLHTQLRRRMEDDTRLRSCRGVHEALRCAQAVVDMCLDSQHESSYAVPDNDIGLAKYFDREYHEHKQLMALFHGSVRVQAMLQQAFSKGIHLHVYFFEKDSKECSACLSVVFHTQSGHILTLRDAVSSVV